MFNNFLDKYKYSKTGFIERVEIKIFVSYYRSNIIFLSPHSQIQYDPRVHNHIFNYSCHGNLKDKMQKWSMPPKNVHIVDGTWGLTLPIFTTILQT